MTLKEAEAIAKIASTADGGCSHCVSSLVAHLNRKFPEFTWEHDGSERIRLWEDTLEICDVEDPWDAEPYREYVMAERVTVEPTFT